MTVAEMIRDARRRHRLSQRSLALRAGTTQAWVSAIERGRAHPSVEMVRRLLLVMGEELVLDRRSLPSDAEHDPIAFAASRRQQPHERLEEALAWMALPVE
jgi:transcriptional regulator with XRE-family HTH domain